MYAARTLTSSGRSVRSVRQSVRLSAARSFSENDAMRLRIASRSSCFFCIGFMLKEFYQTNVRSAALPRWSTSSWKGGPMGGKPIGFPPMNYPKISATASAIFTDSEEAMAAFGASTRSSCNTHSKRSTWWNCSLITRSTSREALGSITFSR